MKTTLHFQDFLKGFEELRPENFSRSGLRALFNHLEEVEENTGEEIEFDVTALCGDYSEYDSAMEAAEDFGWDPLEIDEFDREERAKSWLQYKTTVIDVDGGGVIIQTF